MNVRILVMIALFLPGTALAEEQPETPSESSAEDSPADPGQEPGSDPEEQSSEAAAQDQSLLDGPELPSSIDLGPLEEIFDYVRAPKPWQCVYTYTSDSGPGVPEPYQGPGGFYYVRYHMVDYDPNRC